MYAALKNVLGVSFNKRRASMRSFDTCFLLCDSYACIRSKNSWANERRFYHTSIDTFELLSISENILPVME